MTLNLPQINGSKYTNRIYYILREKSFESIPLPRQTRFKKYFNITVGLVKISSYCRLFPDSAERHETFQWKKSLGCKMNG